MMMPEVALGGWANVRTHLSESDWGIQKQADGRFVEEAAQKNKEKGNNTMTDRYITMQRLRDDMEELFHLCGAQAGPVDIRPAPALIRLVEKLVRDDALYSYLESLDAQAEQAVQAMKGRQLDDWNNRQNEARITELERTLERERAQAREALEEERARAQETEKKLTRELQEEMKRDGRYRKELLSVIQDLIALRDKLLLRKSWLEDQAPEEKNAQKVVDSQLRETARCLTNMGVEILETGGDFDNRFQTAVETRPAETAEQDGQIAETFRPGYRFQKEVLRPQEVILFTTT